VIFSFLYELRSRKVPVGPHEAVALARALGSGLHESSLDGFYHVARSLLVHSEKHLDSFDQAFLKHFHGVEAAALELTQELYDWLKEAAAGARELTEEERQLLESLDLPALQRMLEERLREQRGRHDRGDRWVGTAGTSRFGSSGRNPQGIRVGGEGGGRGSTGITATTWCWTCARWRWRCASSGPSRARAPRTSWTWKAPSTPPRRTPASWR
jgi:uncharacterized protein with von Willebrand factor type A (vWA) domain